MAWINNVAVDKVWLTVQANVDFNALRVRPLLHISATSLSSDEQQIRHRRRRTASYAHYIEANRVRFTMEAIMQVAVLQVCPLLHTSTACFIGPITDNSQIERRRGAIS